MSITLTIVLTAFAATLIIFVSFLLARNHLPVKYALLWYAFAALILLVGLIPGVFSALGRLLGFNIMSDFVVGIILSVSILLNIILTVMIASQRRRINLVSQEVALLKKEIEDVRHKK